MQGVGAKALFLRHDGHLGLPCPKLLEGARALGLKGGPNLAETRAFSSPGPKALAQAKPEWAQVHRGTFAGLGKALNSFGLVQGKGITPQDRRG